MKVCDLQNTDASICKKHFAAAAARGRASFILHTLRSFSPVIPSLGADPLQKGANYICRLME